MCNVLVLFGLTRLSLFAIEENTDLTKARAHWAFQAIQKPAIPRIKNQEWGQSPVDAFVMARLEKEGWSPAPAASRTELIRRVYFDLTGLPPSPAEIEAFLNDKSPKAWEELMDRLLDSPHFGERWGQHWLDVVRYAETEGYEYDRHIPDAWRYRDYVIESFNHDKPFDRFVMEQLAGDEIEPGNDDCETASAFYRLGAVRRNAGNPEIALSRNEVLTERTDIIGAAFLGITLGCARCHNHKLEPISQKDYYRMQAFLASTDEHNVRLASGVEQKDWDAKTATLAEKLKKLREELKGAEGEKRIRLTKEIEDLEDELPEPLATIPAIRDDPKQRTEIHVLKRGVWENKGEAVGPRPPSVLVGDDFPEYPADLTNPRSELAKWIVSCPLTARVIVNRIWQYYFGTGLVKTANDFGLHGDPPSHRELLDWLAATLVENGWKLKPIHRLILLSKTYRESGKGPFPAAVMEKDPENRLLSHFSRRRLSAEEIRDAMLSVSGRLNPRCGGASVMVPVEDELVKQLYKPSQWKVNNNVEEYNRRTIYLIAKRNLRLPFTESFDAPALQTSCPRRESSTHAPQALELLNGKLSNDLARSLAAELKKEPNSQAIAERAYWLATGRAPTAEEKRLATEFLQREPLEEFALAMFNLNAFLYVE